MFHNINIIIKNVLLIFFSALVIIFFIEIILRFFFPQPLKGSWLRQDQTGLYINKNSGMSIDESKYSKRVTYSFDIFYNRKTKKKVIKDYNRILVLGDSYTFGYLLPDGSTYIDKLQNKFLDYQFINSATIGWGSEDYFKFIENYCSFIKPKYILIFFNQHDIARSTEDRFYTLIDNNLIVLKNYNINKIYLYLKKILFFELIIENSHFISVIRQSLTSIYYKSHYYLTKKKDNNNKVNNDLIVNNIRKDLFDNKLIINNFEKLSNYKTLEKVKKIIIHGNNIANACNSELIFINLGLEVDKSKNELINFHINENFFNTYNIKFYDLSDNENVLFYINNTKNLTIKSDGHPNEKGADYIYKALTDVIKDIIKKP